jgi:hypothetical protein
MIVVLICLVAIVLVGLHALVGLAGGFAVVGPAAGVKEPPNSLVFAVVGGWFLLLTLVSHWWAVRGLSRHTGASGVSDAAGGGTIGMLLMSMAIRFAGTFAMLGVLWLSGVVGRQEAVFDVLFWYVTLTTMEVGGIVWASRSAQGIDAIALSSQVDEF